MLIFLDFDGVLHSALSRPNQSLFSQIPLFETFFRQPEWENVQFVVSSTWRLGRDLDDLRRPFSPDFHARIIGTTPDLPRSGSLNGHREREILQWLRDFGREQTAWVALDDLPSYFDKHMARVFLCTSSTGLLVADLPRLAIHLRENGFQAAQ